MFLSPSQHSGPKASFFPRAMNTLELRTTCHQKIRHRFWCILQVKLQKHIRVWTLNTYVRMYTYVTYVPRAYYSFILVFREFKKIWVFLLCQGSIQVERGDDLARYLIRWWMEGAIPWPVGAYSLNFPHSSTQTLVGSHHQRIERRDMQAWPCLNWAVSKSLKISSSDAPKDQLQASANWV